MDTPALKAGLEAMGLTFLVGPIGLVAYFVVRAAVVRKLPGMEPPTSHRAPRSRPVQ